MILTNFSDTRNANYIICVNRKQISLSVYTKIIFQILIISISIIIFTLFCAGNCLAGSASLNNQQIFISDIVLGNRNTSVVFIEYFAPTCAHCYHLQIFHELKSKYIDTGRIAYVMRECVRNRLDFDTSVLETM